MRVVDGSMMEGGGQLLRMAVTYSSILGEPVRVTDVRSGRSQPGLRPQHLMALKAVAEISGAETRGLEVGSREIEYSPGTIRGGEYRLDIGTAGSISLILQCVAPVAAYADSPVTLLVRGGTSVRWSPPMAIVQNVVWPALHRMGFTGELTVTREGFYPKGGGEVEARFTPIKCFKGVRLVRRAAAGVSGVSVSGGLPRHVAERQAQAAKRRLQDAGYPSEIEVRHFTGASAPLSPGSYICLWAQGPTPMGADAMGERGKTAERVGEEAAGKLLGELGTGACVDQYTGDNLILPCSLAEEESVYTTSRVTGHTLTAAELARLIIGADIHVEGREGSPGRIRIKGKCILNRSAT